MPTPISSGTPDPRNFIDDPGDTSYKWAGPGSPGRGSGRSPAALAIGAGGGGYAPGGSGAFGFGLNPLMRRRLLGGGMMPQGGRGGVAPSGPMPSYGGPGVDPSQFSGSTMMGAGGGMPWPAAGGPKAGAMPQAYGWGDRMPQGRGPMGWGRPGTMPIGGGPAGQPAPSPAPGGVPAPPDGGQGYLNDAINRLRTPGAANQHDYLNVLTWLALGGQSPLLEGSALDPRGTAAGREARRQETDRTRAALQRRSKLAAASRGSMLDPSQRAFGDFYSDLGINQGLADANMNAENASVAKYDDFMRQLLANQAGYNLDLGRSDYDFIRQRMLAGEMNQGGGIPGMIGQIAGGAAGGWLSPGGLWG